MTRSGLTPTGGGGFRRKRGPESGTAGIVPAKSPGGTKHTRPADLSPTSPAVRNGQTRWTETRSTHRTSAITERTAEIRSLLPRTGPAGTALQPRAVRQPAELLKSRKTNSPISGENPALRTAPKPAPQEPRRTTASDKVRRDKVPAVRSGPAAVMPNIPAKPLANSRLTKRDRHTRPSAIKMKPFGLSKSPAARRYIPNQRGGDRRGK